MRAILGWILAAGLIVSPAMAGTGSKDSSADAAKSDSSAAAQPAASEASNTKADAKPAASSLESEMNELRDLLDSQAKQLETQNEQLQEQQKQMQKLEEQLKATSAARENLSAAPAPATSAATSAPSTGVLVAVAAATPTVAAITSQPAAAIAQGGGNAVPESPLQFKIGGAFITPIGFMDFTGVYRSRDNGSGIGTNFAAIPYGNPNVVNSTVFQNNLSEFRFSMQNSRVGFRVDALVKGAHVIGYMESDFLGNNPANVAVSSNSNTFRSRLYWVDVAKGPWEVLGGQSWSLITPGRTGISPLPGNIFFSQDIDVNYQAGLVWGRIPEFRFVYHPSNKVALAFALDSQEQYIGGSAGGSAITLPGNAALATAYGGGTSAEFNNGNTTLNTPNIAPDIIVKLAIDPSPKFHAEAGGLERQFKAWDPVNATTFSATGAGVFVNLGFDLFKGFRVLTNNFWSDGGGRYIFGQVPDLIAHADGSLSLIHVGSTVTGFEFTHANTLLYAYYGGIYVSKNATVDANGTTPIGYGFPGSPSGQNRTIQEETVGFNQTFWRNPTYGALNLMGQYSYLARDPWALSNAASVALGSPKDAHLNMIFLNLRYTLPGAAPAAAALR
jgi:hypothetical protein